MNKESVLITGSDGVVGSYIDFGIHTDRSMLDVTNLSNVMDVCKKHMPKKIIHLAAATDLAWCEKEPAQAHFINAVGAYHMALAAREIGAKLIYVSTSGVFDGTKKEPYTEEDMPEPVNVYGHSKYLGELAVAGVLSDYLIVRTSWVFGGGKGKDTKFVGKIMSQIKSPEIKAVTDKHGSPTYAKDLAQAIKKLIEEDARGIIHLGGGKATRFEVAKEIISIVGSTTSVLPVTSDDFPSIYISGENESMAASAYMRPWQEALRDYIKNEWQ